MRRSIMFGLLMTGFVLSGCQRERPEITPTTLGTNLKRIPRGTMTPFAWPGQDIVKASPSASDPKSDPNAAMASGEAVGR